MITLENYKSGHLQTASAGYRFFMPNPINDQWVWTDQHLTSLLEQAAIRVGELNSFARLVPNIDLFIQLHVTKEAVVSSRIEGTQTNMDEALLSEAEVAPERRNDWREVSNYVAALNTAIAELDRLPLSSRLIRNTHRILLDSVRGEHKLPGEFRRSQNWIGGSSPADAVFVPPQDHYVDELMGDLENFLHNDRIAVPALIRIGIAHYQFETIHPFLDGNGRVGRLLITLFLVDKGILSKPLLYLSSFFERNKSQYYDYLTFVRTRNDMTQWLKYFLQGVAETAQQAAETLSGVLQLKTETEARVHQLFGRRSHKALILLQHLFQRPVIGVQEAATTTKLSFKAANDLVADFVKEGLLRELTGQTRNRLFIFDAYVQKFRSGT